MVTKFIPKVQFCEVCMFISLNEVEAQHCTTVQRLVDYDEHITAVSLIEISDTLFKTFKIKNLSNLDDEDSDMNDHIVFF